MPLVDITNPAVIKFLIENYEKENRLRLNWIHKHKEQIQDAATLSREPTNYFEDDVIAHNMIGGMATITRDHLVAGYNRRKTPIRDGIFIPGVKHLRRGHSIVDVGLGDPKADPKLSRPVTDLSVDPIMRPVDPKLTKIMYKSKPEFGREQYLVKRAHEWPEKKYYFAECSNFEYGWRMKDSALRQSKPQYGRCRHLMRVLHTRVGPQPDPPHYKSSEPPTDTKPEYGWRMKDSALRQSKPQYGRCRHLMRVLHTRVGPQPDPPHYKSSEPPTDTKCVAL